MCLISARFDCKRLDSDTFSDADVARHARAYAAPEHLRAALEIYRAFPPNEKFNAAQQSVISLPLVLAPGEHSPFEKLMPGFAEALRDHGVQTSRLKSSKTACITLQTSNPRPWLNLSNDTPRYSDDGTERYAEAREEFEHPSFLE
jgi:hypothetical protein